jgi:hypothetical protein
LPANGEDVRKEIEGGIEEHKSDRTESEIEMMEQHHEEQEDEKRWYKEGVAWEANGLKGNSYGEVLGVEDATIAFSKDNILETIKRGDNASRKCHYILNRYNQIDSALWSDPEFLGTVTYAMSRGDAIIASNGFRYILDLLPKEHFKDKEFLLKVISKDFYYRGSEFTNMLARYIDKELWRDENFRNKFLVRSYDAYSYFPDDLKNDEEVFLESVWPSQGEPVGTNKRMAIFRLDASESIRKNKTVIFKLLEMAGYGDTDDIYQGLPEEYKTKEFILEVAEKVTYHARDLKDKVPEEWFSDEDFVKKFEEFTGIAALKKQR